MSDQISSEFNSNQLDLSPYRMCPHWLAQVGLCKQRRKHDGRHHYGYFDHEDESNVTYVSLLT